MNNSAGSPVYPGMKTTRIHRPLETSDLQRAAAWAYGTARRLGLSWETERNVKLGPETITEMIWVTTPDGNTVGCDGFCDFVRFVGEEQRTRG